MNIVGQVNGVPPGSVEANVGDRIIAVSEDGKWQLVVEPPAPPPTRWQRLRAVPRRVRWWVHLHTCAGC